MIQAFPLLATEVINSQPSLLESIRSIKKSPMLGHRLLKEYQRHLLQRFNFKTLPLIDQKLSEENTSNVNNTEAFCYAITLLYSNAKVIYSWLDIFEVSEGIRNSFLSKIRGQCQSALTPLLLEHARIFFGNLTLYLEPPLSIEDYRSIFFKLLPGKDGELLLSFLTTPPPVCSSKECIIIHQLSETGILELLEPFLIKVARQRISEFTRKLDPADSQLQSALNWFHHLLFPTIAYCLQSIDLKTVYQRLITDLFESIIQNSADTIFDIILNQENFHDAIIGIKLCLKATNHYSLFVRRVQLQLKQRLLHPGARTIDIILFFVATIKLFRILDPSGLLLSECTKELCDYIRTQRKDTVKSMVQILFDSSRRLKNELAGEKIVFPRQEPVLKVSDQVDFEYCWQPAKFSSETLNPSPILPSADILSILVSVYQSKDAFIREYQLSMSEALMKKIGFQVHDFIEDIEQLKARFGECSLNACDAMIRDVKESYRLNKMAHAQFSETSPLEVLIISHLFWPSLEFTSFTLHPNIQRYDVFVFF
ncbi:hypothetical protein HMI54_004889 [Coelomomyces lativittatus]|nr:hypothetical protein HMI54_004889 [Coelomomyces lativittatus]